MSGFSLDPSQYIEADKWQRTCAALYCAGFREVCGVMVEMLLANGAKLVVAVIEGHCFLHALAVTLFCFL